MLRAREAVAHRQRRDQHFVDAELLEAPRGADDIDDRIDRADFMKMHVLGRRVMHLRLGSASTSKIAIARWLHGRGQRRRLDQRANLAEVTLGLRLRHLDIELERRDSAQSFAPRREPVACQRHRLERALEFAKIRAAIEHRADEHVAAEAGERVEISRFHRATLHSNRASI